MPEPGRRYPASPGYGPAVTDQIQSLPAPAPAGPVPVSPPVAAPLRLPRPALLRAMRVRQWTKNLLVLGAPVASGKVLDPHVLLACVVAFGLFCALASSVYLLNDVRDIEEDRRHPRKRHRAIAAGDLSPRTAVGAAAVLAAGAVAAGFAWAPDLGLTLVIYLLAQAGYSLALKDQPAIDLALVSSGFLLRAVAGGTAAGVAMSPWFLLVATFGSLFMVAGKRYSEIRRVGAAAGTRRSLEHYSESYLRFIWSMAAGVTVVVYSLWALNGVHAQPDGPAWGAISVGPFVLGLLRYAADIDRGTAESPEDIVLKDRHLQAIGAIWLLLVLLHATTH
jgi:decaprenyl-phosphate phosphoribosyltransferase